VRYGAAAPLAITLLLGAPAAAQTIQGQLFGVAAANSEQDNTRQARGLGVGAAVRADSRRFRFEGRALHAELTADFSTQSNYNLDQLELTGTWFWRPFLALQVGWSRRRVKPELTAQDVGLVRLGLMSEARLTRAASIWVRGACLPASKFSGGGIGGLGLEAGLGAVVGGPDSRWQGFAGYDYQRINRTTSAGPTPLHLSIAQAGVRVRLR